MIDSPQSARSLGRVYLWVPPWPEAAQVLAADVPPEMSPLQKGHADAHPRATAETVVAHAGGILRGRSPGTPGRPVARLAAVRPPPRGAGTALAHQISPG